VKRIAAVVALIAIAIVLSVLYPALRHPLLLVVLWHQQPAELLPMPVEGVKRAQLTDSWGSPRPGRRHHQGIDIFAARGTPIRSTTRGIVMTVGDNRLGGHIVKVLGPGLEWHYYAHLDRFADVHAGEAVRPGDILGYVGNSGDAITTPTHLHYGIYGSVGGAMNPYPRLRAINAGSAARR
jgi:murein DD-endopeptidase MepM/ murein hydrolase activator NlpD